MALLRILNMINWNIRQNDVAKLLVHDHLNTEYIYFIDENIIKINQIQSLFHKSIFVISMSVIFSYDPNIVMQ